MDWRVWTPPTASASRSSSRATTTACSTCCGAGAAASSRPTSWLVASNHPDLRADVDAFGLPYHHVPVDRGDKAAGRGAAPRAARGQRRPRGAGPLHADPLRRVPRPARRAGDQHPPLVPARVRRRRALRARQGARGQAHRRHGPLRDRGPRRRADHRAGRRCASPTATPPTSWRGWAPTSSGPSSRARCGWHCEDRVLVHGNTTVVF